MNPDHSSAANSSVTDWIDSLKGGSPAAVGKIWHRFVERLVREADRRLRSLPRRAVDEEDIAQEAFEGFFRGVQAHRFSKLDDRNDLWQILIMLVDRRSTDQIRRVLGHNGNKLKELGGSVIDLAADRTEAGGRGQDFQAPAVTPASADELVALIRRSFPKLDDEQLLQITLDRASNYSVAEIADRHGMTLRTVERKLELIRHILEQTDAESKQ